MNQQKQTVRTSLMFSEALAETMRENCRRFNLTAAQNYTEALPLLSQDFIDSVQRNRLPGRRFIKVVKLRKDIHSQMKEMAERMNVSMSDIGEACIRYLNEKSDQNSIDGEYTSYLKNAAVKDLILELEYRGYSVTRKTTR